MQSYLIINSSGLMQRCPNDMETTKSFDFQSFMKAMNLTVL